MRYTLLLFRDALLWVLFPQLVSFPASTFYMVLDFTQERAPSSHINSWSLAQTFLLPLFDFYF